MPDEREISVAVVGLGFGAIHARVLSEMPGVRLAAVCDQDETRLAAVARGRTVNAYTDFRCLLGSERLDALMVAVPTRLHLQVATAALSSVRAVLIEKPLAPVLQEGRELAGVAASAGVALMPGHIERFNPAVQQLKRRLGSGEGGRVLQLTAWRLGPFAARTRDVSVVHDLAFHDIDVMRYLLDADFERVYAETQANVRTEFDDSVSGLLRFKSPDGGPGPVGLLEANWLTPRKVRQLEVLCDHGLFVLDYLAQTLEFHQSEPAEGSILRGNPWPALANLRGAESGPVIRLPVEPREPLEHELAAFVAAVRDGTPMPVAAEDALAALSAADALTESARTGQPVVPERP